MRHENRLRRKDENLIEMLIQTGMSKNIARTLVFLSKRQETSSVDIEKATGLRQPEVSIATQELRRRHWVEKREIKKEGKGRPVHAYRLAIPFPQIVELVAERERAKIEAIERNARRLKRIVA